MNEFTLDGAMRYGPRREDGTARFWALARKCVLGLALALACQSALAQAMYRIKPLGFLGGCTTYAPTAGGLNKADQVTGDACNANGDDHAFLWKNDGTPMVDLGPSEGGSTSYGIALNASGLVAGNGYDSTGQFSFVSSGDGTPMTRIYDVLGGSGLTANAINDLGQVTGGAYTTGDTAYHAFVWKNDGSPMLDLGTFGGSGSEGYAINASGQIAGASDLRGNRALHAFVWKNDGTPMLDLGTLGGNYAEGYFINASGQVAGVSTLIRNSFLHPFLWRNDGTPMQYLGTLGKSFNYLYALNDAGQVAGYSYTDRGVSRAIVWLNDGTPIKDLGTLGGMASAAFDMNSSGQVTGYANLAGDTVYHAFLWSNDGTRIKDLNKLIDPTDPLKPYVTLTNGLFINDRSDIVAQGTDSRTGLEGLYLIESSGFTTSVLTLTPRSLAFGNVPVNTSSAAQSVTVTNTSAKAVAITNIALRGTAPKQFAFTDDCGQSLAGHATCTLEAQFTPTTKGAKTAYLDVNGGGGGLRSVKLTGTGT
jgi:probable HAF family extracellular repeat protein